MYLPSNSLLTWVDWVTQTFRFMLIFLTANQCNVKTHWLLIYIWVLASLQLLLCVVFVLLSWVILFLFTVYQLIQIFGENVHLQFFFTFHTELKIVLTNIPENSKLVFVCTNKHLSKNSHYHFFLLSPDCLWVKYSFTTVTKSTLYIFSLLFLLKCSMYNMFQFLDLKMNHCL